MPPHSPASFNFHLTLPEQVYRKVALKLVKGGSITIEKIAEPPAPATESATTGAPGVAVGTEVDPGGATTEALVGAEASKERPEAASEAAEPSHPAAAPVAGGGEPEGASGDSKPGTAPLQQKV